MITTKSPLRASIAASSFARAAAVASALLAALVTGCSGSTDLEANRETVLYKSTLFALNGTPIGAPTALNTPTAFTVRADVGYDFDIAFDLDAGGHPIVFTQRAVGIPLSATGHEVSLQAMTGVFDAVTEAPSSGWVADSVLTLTVGQVIAVRAGTTACQLDVSPFMYSKVVIDSVNLVDRRLFLSVVTDPNCGFRSFEAGRPRH